MAHRHAWLPQALSTPPLAQIRSSRQAAFVAEQLGSAPLEGLLGLTEQKARDASQALHVVRTQLTAARIAAKASSSDAMKRKHEAFVRSGSVAAPALLRLPMPRRLRASAVDGDCLRLHRRAAVGVAEAHRGLPQPLQEPDSGGRLRWRRCCLWGRRRVASCLRRVQAHDGGGLRVVRGRARRTARAGRGRARAAAPRQARGRQHGRPRESAAGAQGEEEEWGWGGGTSQGAIAGATRPPPPCPSADLRVHALAGAREQAGEHAPCSNRCVLPDQSLSPPTRLPPIPHWQALPLACVALQADAQSKLVCPCCARALSAAELATLSETLEALKTGAGSDGGEAGS